MRRALLLIWLIVLWLLLWRDPSLPNLIAGGLVALAVTTAYQLPGQRDPNLHVRPWRLLVFMAYFLWELVSSNMAVARAIASPRDRIHTAILAVPLPGCSDLVTTVVGNALSLTPGSLTIEVGHEPRTIYVHVLHVHDVEETRDSVHQMVRMGLRALVTDQVLTDFDRAVANSSAGGATDDGFPASPSGEGTS